MKHWVARAPRAVGVALLLVGVCHAEADTVGAMKQVVKTVYGTPSQGQQAVTRIGDPVVHNESFETWRESHALVEFMDGSHLSVGANSKVVIDDFVFDPAKAKGNALIKLTVGTLRFVTGQMPHGGVVIKTPTATLTLRGTDVTVHVHPDGTTDATVTEGHVDAHNDSNGQTSDLGPGDGTTVGEGGNQSFGGNDGADGSGGDGGGGDNTHTAETRRDGNGPTQDFTAHNPSSAPSGDEDSEDGGEDGGCDCI
jgi:FecR protein